MNNHKISLRNLIVFSSVLTVIVTLLGINVWSSSRAGSAGSHVILLRSSGAVPEDSGVGFVGSIYSTSTDDQSVYLVNALTGDAKQYREGPQAALSAASRPMVTGSNGSSAYVEGDSTVVIVNSAGKQAAKFTTYPVISLGVLSNGDIVVASRVRKNFIHVYNTGGQLLKSYGKIRNYTLGDVDDAQKSFFHRGKLLVDRNDNIYYVFQYIPLIQKYSSAGNLIFERQVEGKAVDMEQDVAGRFSRISDPGTVGGIDILNDAAVDNETGHLWVCMNGSSDTGIVYEYSEQGKKIREYALQVDSPLEQTQRITGLKGIAITRLNLYALTGQHRVFTFNIRDDSTWSRADGEVRANTACGSQQPWPACPYTCPEVACNGSQPTATSSTGLTVDCKVALQSALATGWTLVTTNSCVQISPGTGGTPPHPRGGCREDVTVCYDGQNFTAGVVIDCPAPPAGSCN